MQTLKTAIVVLLMMTVMYGCYVSLTAAPEPLPDQVAELLIEDSGSFDELGIDTGLPDSLASLGISDSVPSSATRATYADIDDGPAELTFSDGPAGDYSGEPVSGRDMGEQKPPKPADSSTAVAPDFGKLPSNQAAERTIADPQSFDSVSPSGGSGASTTASWESSISDPSPGSSQMAPKTKPNGEATENVGLTNAIQTADRQYAADQPAEALATLSLFYNTPNITDQQRVALLGRLDPLAATVIYSRKHLLEQPHRVGQAETLMEIAARYELPWQLLANINSIDDPIAVLPGTELKVVRGPFRAEVDLSRQELTIFLGDLYAGRFQISVGSAPSPQEGSYTVQDKQSSRTFYDKNGSPIPAGDARNPYGNVWLDLGKQLCIHGSPDRSEPSDQGCISLRGADAEDLFGILTQGSSVTIRR